MLPEGRAVQPKRCLVVLARLVADWGAEGGKQQGEAGTDDLEPLLRPVELVLGVLGLDGVFPVARVDPGRGDTETDNVGDPSVEINVEELIHEIEAEGESSRPGRELAAKRRLEDLMERKRSKRELEDFDDYDI